MKKSAGKRKASKTARKGKGTKARGGAARKSKGLAKATRTAFRYGGED